MKHDVTHTRPFSVDLAKAGAPYCCRDGREVEMFKWDRPNLYPLLGCYDEKHDAGSWTTGGKFTVSSDEDHVADLVLLPLGILDGKPVFAGDELESILDGTKAKVGPGHRVFKNCRWPAPVKAYPILGITHQQLLNAFGQQGIQDGSPMSDGFRRIADATIMHAIDTGAVVSKEDHVEALNRLGHSLSDVTISDVMIAALKDKAATHDMVSKADHEAAFKRFRERINAGRNDRDKRLVRAIVKCWPEIAVNMNGNSTLVLASVIASVK